jgi:hypothetical protein
MRIWEFHFSPTTSEPWLAVSTDAGNPLVRQHDRYLTEGWPKSPEAQAKGDHSQQTGRGRPCNGHQVDQTNRAQQSAVGRFSATPTEILPRFSSVVRRMSGCNFMIRWDTARIPLQALRPHQSACIQSRIRSCDYATLRSIPESLPTKVWPPI